MLIQSTTMQQLPPLILVRLARDIAAGILHLHREKVALPQIVLLLYFPYLCYNKVISLGDSQGYSC